jgi:hypothetical protein
MRFRFTIRDLLWLTALAALAVTWWLSRADNQRLQADIQSLQKDLTLLRSKPASVTIQYPPISNMQLIRPARVSIRDESVEQAMKVERLRDRQRSQFRSQKSPAESLDSRADR